MGYGEITLCKINKIFAYFVTKLGKTQKKLGYVAFSLLTSLKKN